MKEELTRVLTASDPNVPTNISKYSYKDSAYKIDPPGASDNTQIHFSLEGRHVNNKFNTPLHDTTMI